MATLNTIDERVQAWLARPYVRRTKLDERDEDGPTWYAWLPQFGIQAASGCGETEEQAQESLTEVLRASFLAMAERGDEPPPALSADQLDLPRDDREATNLPSGNLRVRLPRELHAELILGAERNGCSLNTYIVTLLSKRSVEDEVRQELARLSAGLGRKTGAERPASAVR